MVFLCMFFSDSMHDSYSEASDWMKRIRKKKKEEKKGKKGKRIGKNEEKLYNR